MWKNCENQRFGIRFKYKRCQNNELMLRGISCWFQILRRVYLYLKCKRLSMKIFEQFICFLLIQEPVCEDVQWFDMTVPKINSGLYMHKCWTFYLKRRTHYINVWLSIITRVFFNVRKLTMSSYLWHDKRNSTKLIFLSKIKPKLHFY